MKDVKEKQMKKGRDSKFLPENFKNNEIPLHEERKASKHDAHKTTAEIFEGKDKQKYDPEQGQDMSNYKPVNMVNLVISCRRLKNLDFGTDMSDPLCEVFIKEENSCGMPCEWSVVDRTETIQNELNPNFTKWIKLPYMFEAKQNLKFEVRDYDQNGEQIIGFIEASMAEIMAQKGKAFKRELNPPHGKKYKVGDCGLIKIHASSDDGCNNDILIQVGQVSKLRSLAGLCRDSNQPYFVIERASNPPEEVCKGYNFEEHKNYTDFDNYRPLIVYTSDPDLVNGLHPKFKEIKKKM